MSDIILRGGEANPSDVRLYAPGIIAGAIVELFGDMVNQSTWNALGGISGSLQGEFANQSTWSGFAGLSGFAYGSFANQSTWSGFAGLSGFAYGSFANQSTWEAYIDISALQSIIDGSNLKSRRFLLTAIPVGPGETRPARSRRSNRRRYKEYLESV